MSTDMGAQDERRARDKPESLRLRSISPALTVNDLQASIAWYRDIVGFTVEQEWEHEGKVMGVSLVAGTAHLMIAQDDWAKGRDRVKGVGFRMHMVTVQDVDQIAAAIKERGGTLATEPADMPWGVRAFNLVDPDGFQMTVSSAT